mmetsp:Transcript_16372/g.38389  ORF Transcript_16372/g.38389 Transcript_16372/m.38389 type:complete len:300 (-) Transcript_16372:81-980(-)
MGQACQKPAEEDDDVEVNFEQSFRIVPPPRKQRVQTLNTDSAEAQEAETNPFKDDVVHESSASQSKLADRGLAASKGRNISSDLPADTPGHMSEPDPEESVLQGSPRPTPVDSRSGSAQASPVKGLPCSDAGMVVVLSSKEEGGDVVQALALPYAEAPVLGEILNGESAELLSESGDYLQVRWNGLKVWVARKQSSAPAAAGCKAGTAGADPEAGGGGGVQGVYFVGQDVELFVNGWVQAKITGILGSGLIQVRSALSGSQAAEEGVEAQCGVWLTREQQQELLRPSPPPDPSSPKQTE